MLGKSASRARSSALCNVKAARSRRARGECFEGALRRALQGEGRALQACSGRGL